MVNNKPQPKYTGIKILATYLIGTVAGITGFPATVGTLILSYFFNWLAKHGIYFINVIGTNIQTNMDRDTFTKVMGDGWIDGKKEGITDVEGKKIDNKVIASFDKFVVYTKVQ